MNKRTRNSIVGGFFGALLIGLIASRVLDAESGVAAIGPGTETHASQIACDANINTCVFEYNGDDSAATRTDYLLIPDRTPVLVKLHTAGVSCMVCWLMNPDATLTSWIGNQATNSTANEVETVPGPCFKVSDFNPSSPALPKSQSFMNAGLLPTGVCSAASANDKWSDVNLYMPCANDADCNNIAGVPASTPCNTTNPSNIVDVGGRVRAYVLGARCSAAATLTVELTN